MNARTLVLAATLLAGCAPADKVDALEQRVATLEGEVKALKANPGASRAAKGAAAATGTNSAAETKANALLKDIAALSRENKFDEAKAKLATLKTDYGTTTAYRKARKMEQELSVIGKDAPATWEVEKWYQGEDDVDLTSGKPTLVVFFEAWCPHCKHEAPALETRYQNYRSMGLQVVGFTKVTKSSTDAKVMDFLKEGGVTFPIAKETGALSKWFNVSGIPAAALVKDGKIVWRGHPARLSDDQLKAWL
ncbi:MAG: redoxin domain-containing protein [Oligoflexia bacterium]|nr:redoxin domain-containing protein [Oligoflexia bacterium]